MKRLTPLSWILLLLTIAILGVWLTGCASFPPKNPDGSINVAILVQYADDGIQADCRLMPGSALCTIGSNVIAILKTKGQDPAAVLAALQDAEMRFPVVRPYTHWLTTLLGG